MAASILLQLKNYKQIGGGASPKGNGDRHTPPIQGDHRGPSPQTIQVRYRFSLFKARFSYLMLVDFKCFLKFIRILKYGPTVVCLRDENSNLI